jgi:hypothetical protein
MLYTLSRSCLFAFTGLKRLLKPQPLFSKTAIKDDELKKACQKSTVVGFVVYTIAGLSRLQPTPTASQL